MSPAVHRSPMRRNSSDRSDSPVRNRSSPRRKSPIRREKSPVRHRSPRRIRSPARANPSNRTRSPEEERPAGKIRSSSSRSPSPRTKRLRRAQIERETEKSKEKQRGREKTSNRDRSSDSPPLVVGEKRSRRDQTDKIQDKLNERERVRGSDREGEKKSHREKVQSDVDSSRGRHGRQVSPPVDRNHRNRHGSHSPQPSRVSKHGARDETTDLKKRESSRDEQDSLSKLKAAEEALEAKQKQKPSFELSGKLAEETNRVRGVTLLFTEPPDARKPNIRWRLYVFKAGEVLNEPLYVHRQSCYLFGRERKVADIPTDHPSCSKQHAVIQFRLVEKEQPDELLSKQVRPYLMDLGSTNGTFINDNRIEPQRYYELFEKDTIRFGNSSREYVMLHENSTA